MAPLPDSLAHLRDLQVIFQYQAPPGPVRPFLLPGDREVVEIVTGGKVNFSVNGRMLAFGRGAMFWHQAGETTIHLNHPDNPYACLALGFRIHRAPARRPPRVSRWQSPDEAQAFVNLMLEQKESTNNSREFLAFHAYSRLLLEADRAARHNLMPEPWPVALGKAVSIIEGRFADELALPEVAAEAGISVPYLHGLFTAHLNRSPHRMILDLRLAKARGLLIESPARLREIADACGFTSPEYFCRIFTKEHGITPMAYRKSHTPYTGRNTPAV